MLALDKKLEKLFIVPKARQELMRRRSVHCTMRVCEAHGFQIKGFNLKLVSMVKMNGFAAIDSERRICSKADKAGKPKCAFLPKL